MSSTNCVHTYEREAIIAHIRNNQRRGNVKCPVAGCSRFVTENSLIADAQMVQHVAKHKQNQQLASQDDDAVAV